MINNFKLRVGVDVDGVLRDSVPSFINYLNQSYGFSIPEQPKEYDIYKYTNLSQSEFRKLLSEDMEIGEVLNAAPEIYNSADILRRWYKEESDWLDIYILSSQPNPLAIKLTLDWLYSHRLIGGHIIFTPHKHHIILDIMVDDNPNHLIAFKDSGTCESLYVVDASYNRSLPDDIARRIKSLTELENQLRRFKWMKRNMKQ